MAATQSSSPLRPISRFWRFRDWHLFPKLMVAALLVVVLSLSISGYDSITSSRDALLAQGTLNLKASSSHTSAAIDAYLLANRNAIAAASALPDTVTFATTPNNSTAGANALKTLKKFKTQFDYESIVIVNPQGLIILDTAEQESNTNVKSTRYFSEAMRGIVGYVSDPSISVTTNRPAIFFSAPVFDSAGNILAVISARANLDQLWAIVEKDWGVAGAGAFGVLLDEYGIRIAHSSSAVNRQSVEKSLFLTAVAPLPTATVKQLVAEKRFGNASVENVPVLPLPEVAAAMSNPQIETFESSADGSTARHYASLSVLTVKPWRYVVMAPLPVFTKSADDLAIHFFLILLLVGGLTGIGAFFFARAIARPIVSLTQVADRISMGELDTKIEIDQKDEIGELAEAFSRMQASMQVILERLRAHK